MVSNDHRTSKTWGFLPANITYHCTAAGRAPLLWAVLLSRYPVSQVPGEWSLTQSHSMPCSIWILPPLGPSLPSNTFSFDLKQHLPLIFSHILNCLLKFQPQLSSNLVEVSIFSISSRILTSSLKANPGSDKKFSPHYQISPIFKFSSCSPIPTWKERFQLSGV